MIWEPSTTVLEVDKPYSMAAGQNFTRAFLEANNLTNSEAAGLSGGYLVPHANFHICKDVIGFCTPFITAACGAPKTFTSTPAVKMGAVGTQYDPSNVPEVYPEMIEQEVKLPAAGRWVAIWHIKVGDHSIAIARFLTAIDEPKCPIGFEEIDDVANPCRPCGAGFRGTEQRTCEPCPVGYYSPKASSLNADGTVA